MTRAAFAGAVEVGPPGVGAAREHVRRALWITIFGRRLNPILEEMREIGHLSLRQVGLVVRQPLERGCDLIAQTVAKDQRGTNQVGTLLGALRECAMTID